MGLLRLPGAILRMGQRAGEMVAPNNPRQTNAENGRAFMPLVRRLSINLTWPFTSELQVFPKDIVINHVARVLRRQAKTLDLPAFQKRWVESEMPATARTGHPLLVIIVLSALCWATLITAALAVYSALSLLLDAPP